LSFLVVSPSVSKLRGFEKIKAVNTFETASTSPKTGCGLYTEKRYFSEVVTDESGVRLGDYK